MAAGGGTDRQRHILSRVDAERDPERRPAGTLAAADRRVIGSDEARARQATDPAHGRRARTSQAAES